MKILEVKDLTKKYEKFTLDKVSFNLEAGCIMGFIGRNGAGKSTTIKSMLNMVHPDSGSIKIFGKEFSDNEFFIKQNIGVVLGGIDFYPRKKLKTLTNVTKRFYENWDETEYEKCIKLFELDEDKRADQLSAGMKVKYMIALALSHRAKLLIFDEPTSGLDPVSRDELLDIFERLVKDTDRSILFSTHITSDLEKCAGYITYIKDGQILASDTRDNFQEHFQYLKTDDANGKLSLEDIMVRIERKNYEEFDI